MRVLEFSVSGRTLQVSLALWRQLQGPKPAPGYACNGCSWSPDALGSYKLWPACVIHDRHYEGTLGGTWHARRTADRILRTNIYRVLQLQGAPELLARSVATIYYGRVRLWGAKAFAFRDDEQPASFWLRLREAYGAWEPRPAARSETASRQMRAITGTKP